MSELTHAPYDTREAMNPLADPWVVQQREITRLRIGLAAADARVERAAKRYEELYDWISKAIATATYAAEELNQGEKAWQPLADSMYNGIMASFCPLPIE